MRLRPPPYLPILNLNLNRDMTEAEQYLHYPILGRYPPRSTVPLGTQNPVSDWFWQITISEDIQRIPQSGRPPVLSHWDQKWMENIVVNEPTSTVDKALHAKRLRPWLKPEHPPKRLEWCNRRRHWEKEEWRKPAWTNECKIGYDPNPARQ